MVALEVLAGHTTIYRRKQKKFEPNGDLDYMSDPGLAFLRNVLDEPVGRFYLIEYCEQKQKKDLLNYVMLWKRIRQLDTGMLSIEEAIERANKGKEKQENDETVEAEEAELDQDQLSMNNRLSSNKIQIQARRKVADPTILRGSRVIGK